MKILFWICTVLTMIGEYYTIIGFNNVYFKNYNGGKASSSGSIVYYMIGGALILIAGLSFYFTGHLKIATAIVGLPVLLLLLYWFVMLILPYMMGERMN